MLRTHDAGTLTEANIGHEVTVTGWIARRRDHGGIAFLDLRDASGIVQVVVRDPEVAHPLRIGVLSARHRPRRAASRGQREPRPDDRSDRAHRRRGRGPERVGSAPVPHRRARRRQRGGPAALALPGSAAFGAGSSAADAQRGEPAGPRGPARAGLRRDRDADADPIHARGRPRLPGAGPAVAGPLVRPAAVAPVVQATADGGRDGALLPARPVLPRRGLPRRPATGVHPARHRDVVRRTARCDAGRRGDRPIAVGGDGGPRDRRDPEHHLRRVDGAVRHRQARHALRAGTRRPDRLLRHNTLPGLPGRARRSSRDARRRQPTAPDVRRLAGVGQAARRQGAGLRHGGRGRRTRRAGGQEHQRRRANRTRSSRRVPSRATASSSRPGRATRRARSWVRRVSRSPHGSAWCPRGPGTSCGWSMPRCSN